MSYADLEIHIQRKGDKGRAGYPVDITFMGEVEFPTGELDAALPLLSTLSSGLDPARDGEALHGWFFKDPRLTAAWAEARGKTDGRRVRLRIDDGAAELQRIPWELLRDPGDGGVASDLAATPSTPFSRYIAGRWKPGAPIFKRPIKVLVAVANPADLADIGLSPIDAAAELAALGEAVRGDGDITLIPLEGPCTLEAIRRALGQGVHVLHFIGHGKYVDGQTFLYLCNDAGAAAPAADTDIAGMIRRLIDDPGVEADDKLRMVYLSSCQTAMTDAATVRVGDEEDDASGDRFGFRGLAPLLIAAGAPAVLAMQDFVRIDTARVFSQAFYGELMARGEVDRAVNAARDRVINRKLPGAAIPVLYMRLRSGELLGIRGKLSIDKPDQPERFFWDPLLNRIASGECTPILGPGVTTNFLPSRETIALTLSDRLAYPFADRHNLPRVAQFLEVCEHGTRDRDRPRDEMRPLLVEHFRKSMGLSADECQSRILAFRAAARPPLPKRGWLSELAEAVNWSEASVSLFENEIHRQLAELDLPLYLTTNTDNFMTLALRARQRNVRREASPWLEASVQRGEFDPAMSPETPVVLHLFGNDADPTSTVLTEDDHLDYLCLAAREEADFLSPDTKAQIATTALLFLGYRMEDIELKVILRALQPPYANRKPPKLRVGVQIDAEQPGAERERAVIDYFKDYFAKENITIYWGSSAQFMTELSARWRARRANASP
jgi:hypothetical protein